MSKYDGLRDFLATRQADVQTVALSFAEIEKLVGPLPPSARNLRQWWANNSLVQAMAWRAAGWHVRDVNLEAERVVFARGGRGGPARQGTRAGTQAVHQAGDGMKPATFVTVDPTGNGLAGGGPAGDGLAAEVSAGRTRENPAFRAMGRPRPSSTGIARAEVRGMLATHLTREGWDVDPASGPDILATRDGHTLAVLTMGYPASGESGSEGADEAVPSGLSGSSTPSGPPGVSGVSGVSGASGPAARVRSWYADAALRAMLTVDEHPDYEVAVGLPDVAAYRSLHERTRKSLTWIGIRALFVDPRGRVDAG